MGGSEILLILILALIFLGPEKLPDAAKQISKGIRDLKKQSRVLQETIENDEHIGGAIRDLKSALRGDELPVRAKPRKPGVKKPAAALPEGAVPAAAAAAVAGEGKPADAQAEAAETQPAAANAGDGEAAGHAAEAPSAPAEGATADVEAKAAAKPAVTLPPTAGEADPDVRDHVEPDELAALIKPASGTVARSEPEPAAETK